MICEKCQGFNDELICDYVDGSLSKERHASLEESLRSCSSCSQVVLELQTIFRLSRELSEAPEVEAMFDAPPNPEALWRRIANTLEMEDDVKARSARGAGSVATSVKSSAGFTGWINGIRGKRWELSFPQLVMVIGVIAISVSAVTTLSLQRLNYFNSSNQPIVSDDALSATDTNRAINVDDVMRQQQQALDYWSQRVNQRQSHWNPQMREAFNRNMQVVDQVVNDSLFELKRNPHDNISQEMLNAALKDKMEMLKEFSDL